MLVRRKRSNKRKRKFYEVLEFHPGTSIEQITDFLNGLGKIEIRDDGNMYSAWIVLEGNRKIVPNQFLLKDDRRRRILSFDPTIFYDWFDIWNT